MMCVRVMVTLAFLVLALVFMEGGQAVPSKYREKPGFCPLFPAPPPPPGGLLTRGLVLDPEIPDHSQCGNDYDCRGATKCCSTGVCCGRVCVPPQTKPY
ncbi:hypothetical protein Pmani_030854 [Petrolisthes manimaculis]|uniref:WAP domain-containing protein n=1 Tax=Petrolisthes manimaculis TaxID=1843537 RepID=A0AAE1NUS6_9EUCA|nr:hypothetical protein Pmani_030854 [Petrolisthes manimaculis]